MLYSSFIINIAKENIFFMQFKNFFPNIDYHDIYIADNFHRHTYTFATCRCFECNVISMLKDTA